MKIFNKLNAPVPVWLFALWIAGGMSVAALAAIPLYTGSLSVPASGTITDNQLSASQCIGTDASKKEASNANCVQSITGTANQVNASASTGAVTLSLPQSIATGSSPTFTGLTLQSLTLTGGSDQISWPLSGTTGFVGNFGASTGTTMGFSKTGSVLFDVDTSGNARAYGTLQAESDGATKSYVGPAYTTAGAAVASTWHTIVISGVLPGSTSTCLGSTLDCSTFTLSGAAAFASGGSSSTAPSFQCGGGWAYNAGSYGTPAFVNNGGQAGAGVYIAIASGTPNTVYVFTASGAPTLPFYFICSGT